MELYITEPGSKWPAHDSTVKVLFGLRPKDKWPEAGLPERQIQGFKCWVNPLPAKREGRRFRRFALRAYCECHCGTVLPIGRLAQHSKVHA